MAGLVPLFLIQLGEIAPGGVGKIHAEIDTVEARFRALTP